VRVHGPRGAREIPAAELMLGAFETQVAADEILVSVIVPRLSARARWSYYKICRKTGEFADAIGGVLVDPERGVARAVIGATAGAPLVLDGSGDALGSKAAAAMAAANINDAHKQQVLRVALQRAADRMAA